MGPETFTSFIADTKKVPRPARLTMERQIIDISLLRTLRRWSQLRSSCGAEEISAARRPLLRPITDFPPSTLIARWLRYSLRSYRQPGWGTLCPESRKRLLLLNGRSGKAPDLTRQYVGNAGRHLPLGRSPGEPANQACVDDQVGTNAVIGCPQSAKSSAAGERLGEVAQFGSRSHLRCDRMRNRDGMSPLGAPDRSLGFVQE